MKNRAASTSGFCSNDKLNRRDRSRSITAQAVMEAMEDRCLFSSFVVNTTSDAANPGAGLLTLRQAIADANATSGADTITFSSSVFTSGSLHTITLAGSELKITDTSGATTITGPGAGVLAISGNNISRVLRVSSGATASISGMTITRGNATIGDDFGVEGGGIINVGTLTIANSTVSNNAVTGDSFTTGTGITTTPSEGGGIFSSGPLTLNTVTVSGNVISSDVINASGRGGNGSGGGIYATGALTIASSTVTGNTSEGSNSESMTTYNGYAVGGGITTSGTTTITSSTISSNTAAVVNQGSDNSLKGTARGGGIFAYGPLTLNSDTISSNKATGYSRNDGTDFSGGEAGSAFGGGLFAGGTLTVAASTISGNTAMGGLAYYSGAGQAAGGGIYAAGSTASVSTTTISGNTATGGAGESAGSSVGAGILARANLTLTASTVSGNVATGGAGDNVDGKNPGPTGGAVYGAGIYGAGKMVITDSTIANNKAVGGKGGPGEDEDGENLLAGGAGGLVQGGAITTSSQLVLSDSTIVGNSAVGGAGAAGGSGQANGAAGVAQGSGIIVFSGTAVSVNSIISGNTGATDISGTLSSSSGYNIIGTGGGLTNGTNGNRTGVTSLGLGSLANNGGPTQTMLPAAGSVALDHGSNALIPSGTTTDQRGLARISNTIVDIGAVEVQVTSTLTQLTGTVIGTAGSYQNDGNTAAKAFDGDITTYFDAPSSSGDYTGLDLGSAKVVKEIKYVPRSSLPSRMVGGTFQGSNSSTFASGVTNLYTITATPTVGVYTTVSISNTAAFRYVRYVGPTNSYCNVSEIQFFGTAAATATKLTGTIIGTAGSYNNHGDVIANAFDGNFSTFFDAPSASGDWVGLDLGSAKVVTQVKYAPRSGLESRMVGGMIQASNSATFSSGVVTLFTISSTPTAGALTTQALSNTTAYRYYRYIGPTNSYCDISELEFDG